MVEQRSSSDDPDALYRSGIRAAQAGRLAAADRCLSQAVALRPSMAAFHCALGLLRAAQSRFAEALACHDTALALDANHIGALAGRADALHELGRLAEAEASYRRASALAPRAPELRFGWATVLADLGRLEEAVRAYRDLLVLSPSSAEAHVNLGLLMRDLGRLDEAAAEFQAALALKADIAHAGVELVSVLCDLGRSREALRRATPAMLRDPRSRDACRAFAIAVDRSAPLPYSAETAALLERCLSAEGLEHDALARPCGWQLRQKHGIDPSPREAARAAVDAATAGASPACLRDPLLLRLLVTTVNTDIELEKFLTETRLRLCLARDIPADLHPFLAALAVQCFNNGYAFAVNEEEEARVRALRADIDQRLARARAIELDLERMLLRFALYEPLGALALANRLLGIPVPSNSPLKSVIEHCLGEPLEEEALARDIPKLGAIENAVSRVVRDQYEEHPYPRWLSVPPLAPVSLPAMLRKKFPHARLPSSLEGPIEVLVAGCGTGREPIATALSIAHARVLAVDLSLKSLGYAKRMAIRLGASNIDFLHADLLALGDLGRKFHVVEAVGVLHHMEDPLAGWRVLCGLLRPGGFMRIGLYSALARAGVTAAREQIARLRLTPTPRDIRVFRQRLLFGNQSERVPGLALSKDIYDLNGCRDLLFHVREHRYTIPELQATLQALGLEFLGFELADKKVAGRYRADNPDDAAAADLARWTRFETAHPDTFSGMYVFWCRRRESAASS